MSFLSGLGSILGAVAAPFTGGASLLPSLISGGLGLVGSLSQNSSAKQIANSNNAQAIELANTAHQREVRDLAAAGLNPILSAGGNGASTPSLQGAPVNNVLEGAASSAREAQLLSAQTANLRATNKQIQAQTELAKDTARKTRAEANLTIDNSPYIKLAQEASANSAVSASRSQAVQADADVMLGPLGRALNSSSSSIGAFSSLLKSGAPILSRAANAALRLGGR